MLIDPSLSLRMTLQSKLILDLLAHPLKYAKLNIMIVLNLIVVLALISIMIIVHEFGHWIVARKLGFQTPIFGFGLPFGRHIRLGKWNETEFRFHWFVLGGYVAIPELGDESSEETIKEITDIKPLKTFPVWKRACVASAGVLFNIIFAYLVCLVMVATIGPPTSKGNVVVTGFLDVNSNSQSTIKQTSIAKEAGFQEGDLILKINHIKMKEPSDLVRMVKANPQKQLVFKIKRSKIVNGKIEKQILRLNVIPSEEGTIGVVVSLARNSDYDKPSKNPLVWIKQSADVLLDWTLSMIVGLILMITQLFGFSPAGAPKINPDDLHGILAIVSIFAQAITVDPREIYRWTALISVNLAIINLLPIPALDGGHLLFMFIEKIRGKKLAESVQQKAIQAGFFLLILLMFFVLMNDIKGIVSGKFDLMKDKEGSVKKN